MVDDAPIPLEAVPAIRAAVRDPLLLIAGPIDVAVLAARTGDAWHVWHQSTQHRADVGRLLPRLITDARIAARAAGGHDRRAAHAVLADVYALVQHEVVGASETELTWTAADRATTAAQEADLAALGRGPCRCRATQRPLPPPVDRVRQVQRQAARRVDRR